MFGSYFDESGTHGGSRSLAVAGCIADVEQWAKFQAEWSAFLRDEGLTAFRMSLFENRHGEFAGWSEQRRRNALRRAHGIMRCRINIGLGAAVVLQDFDDIIKGTKHFRRTGGAYCLCVQLCLDLVREWARRFGRKEPMAYVFDQGAEGKGQVMRAFDSAREEPSFLIGSITFASKANLVQLQAADLLAYESWKQMENRRVHGPLRPLRRSMRSIAGALPLRGRYMERKALLELVGVLEAEERPPGTGRGFYDGLGSEGRPSPPDRHPRL